MRRPDLQPHRPRRTPAAATVTADNSGQLLVDGIARNYRDPDSPGLDTHPWWAEYLVDYDTNINDLDEFHSFDVNAGIKGLDSWGNDYLAGGADNDLSSARWATTR